SSITNDGTRTFANNFLYHHSGAIKSYLAGNGLTHSTGFDGNRYWVTSINAGGAVQISYDIYDKVGNLKQVTDRGLVQTFTYDALDRLKTANSAGSWGALSFGYDPLGNRTSKIVNGANTTYTYDTASKRLVSATGAESASYGYDDNGNMRTDSFGTYTYT